MTSRPVLVHASGYCCDIGPHVFPMEKFEAVRRAVVSEGLVSDAEILTPEPADRATLALVHADEYLDDLFAARHTARTAGSELPITREIADAYALAAGGTRRAVDEALAHGAAANLGGGFHHAFADRAEGFCYLNDLAVAIAAAQAAGRVERVAVVDVDLHQGNGTAKIFQDDARVFTFSIHQERLYPIKETSDLDIGLENETGDDAYLAALARGLDPVWAHAPELVVMQAGADPFHDDQLGALRLSFAGLEQRDRMVIEGCRSRGIPIAVTLGGGYSRRFEDLVRIHVTTCRVLFEIAARGAARHYSGVAG